MEKVESLLLQAAQAATECGLCLHEFLAGCQAAYANASPALREQLQSMVLLAHVDGLRRAGWLAEA